MSVFLGLLNFRVERVRKRIKVIMRPLNLEQLRRKIFEVAGEVALRKL